MGRFRPGRARRPGSDAVERAGAGALEPHAGGRELDCTRVRGIEVEPGRHRIMGGGGNRGRQAMGPGSGVVGLRLLVRPEAALWTGPKAVSKSPGAVAVGIGDRTAECAGGTRDESAGVSRPSSRDCSWNPAGTDSSRLFSGLLRSRPDLRG